MSQTGSLFRPSRDRALLLSWLLGATVLAVVLTAAVQRTWMMDALTFHGIAQTGPQYDRPPNTLGAYLYSPVFGQGLQLFGVLPWWAFSAVWFCIAAGAYVWLVAPIGWVWAVPLLALALEDVTIGNIVWLMALCCVLGMRWPAVWAVPLLTKVANGFGVVWFAVRRDVRSLLLIGAAVGVLVGVSALIDTSAWREWITFLWDNRGADGTWPFRLLLGATIVAFAARRDRPWLIPIAMFVATPVIMVYSLGLLCAIPRLLPEDALARARAPFGPPSAVLRRALDLPQAGRTAGDDASPKT